MPNINGPCTCGHGNHNHRVGLGCFACPCKRFERATTPKLPDQRFAAPETKALFGMDRPRGRFCQACGHSIRNHYAIGGCRIGNCKCTEYVEPGDSQPTQEV
jgi:hypothetical protein